MLRTKNSRLSRSRSLSSWRWLVPETGIDNYISGESLARWKIIGGLLDVRNVFFHRRCLTSVALFVSCLHGAGVKGIVGGTARRWH